MEDNLNERNSAPTGASETVNDMKLEANEPLGDAACSASCFRGLSWDDAKNELFELMLFFACPENRDKSHSDYEMQNMAHDFAEIATHRSDLKPGVESPSVITFGKCKVKS